MPIECINYNDTNAIFGSDDFVYYEEGNCIVVKEVETTFNISTFVEKEVTTTFNIVNFKEKEITTSFNVFNSVEKEVETSFNAAGMVEKEVSTSFDVLNSMEKEVSTSFNVLEPESKEVETTFNVFNFVEKEVETTFDTSGIVGKEVETTFNVSNYIEKEIRTSFNVTLLNEKEITTSFNVRNYIEKETLTSFNTSTFVSKEVRTSFNVEQLLRVEKEVTTSFKVGKFVEKEVTTSFKVKNRIEKEVATFFKVSSGLVKEVVTSFNVLSDFGILLSGSVLGFNEIKLTWSVTNENVVIDKFILYKFDGLNFYELKEFNNNVFEFTDEDVSSNRTYSYYVKSKNNSTKSQKINIVVPYTISTICDDVENVCDCGYDRFYIDLDLERKTRYDISKFICFQEDSRPEIITSYMLDKIKSLPIHGVYVVQEEKRPDYISYKIYKETWYWWILMLYNGIIDVHDIKVGVQLKYPSVDSLEGIYFNLKSLEQLQQQG